MPSDITARTDAPAGERVELPGDGSPETIVAVRLADRVLDLPGIDSDGDVAVLARQLLRARERHAASVTEANFLKTEVERLTSEADGEFVQAAIRIMKANPGFVWQNYQWDGIGAEEFETFFIEDMNEAWAQVEKQKARADAAEAALSVRVDLAWVEPIKTALDDCIGVLDLSVRTAHIDPFFGDSVRKLGETIGYGAMMTTASALWAEKLRAAGGRSGGEFVAGPCQATALRALAVAQKARGILDAAALAPDPSAAGVAAKRVRPADIGIVGPVDGTNEKHPDGSYFRLVAMRGDEERHQFLFSRGAAECLRDELIGALEKIGRADLAAAPTPRATPAQGAGVDLAGVEAAVERESDDDLLDAFAIASTAENPGRNELRDARQAVLSRMKGASR